MALQINSEEARLLRKLIPLATFPSEAFIELCTNTTVEQVQGAVIFKKGDTDPDLVFLLNGSVTLQADGLVVGVITAESDSAKFALAHQIPRKIDAVANGSVQIVRLNADIVNNPPPVVTRQNYTIAEASDEDSDDWMSAVLRFPVFQCLPPSSLQKILMSLRARHYAEGEVIIDTGKVIDHFYIITKGECLISRRCFGEQNEIKHGVGESFGEEYLIADYPAREMVMALSDVSLIQLEKKLFLSQIKTPLLKFVSPDDMPSALGQGAILLDVRRQGDYEKQHVDGSVNIPLMLLRMEIQGLPRDKQYILACGNGKVSEAGAFLLAKNGFNAAVLKGGMGTEDYELLIEMPEPVDKSLQDLLRDDQLDKVILDAVGVAVESQLSLLRAENERLLSLTSDLEEKNAKLQAEKEEVEQRCLVLTQQLVTLKGFLNKFNSK
jgi:rhodanese-related sulfurtransferase